MANIEMTNITKIYGVPKRKGQLPKGKRAVNDVSFTINDGSFTVLVGPSGCGKTTLLRMIAGLETITLGKLKIGGVDVTNLEPGDRGIAMVFQNYALYPHMNVWQNIEFGLKNARIPNDEVNERIHDVLKIVDLEEYANRRPANLSGGQRQRVALARAIAKKPQVFLMDEPLSNLDAKLRSSMRTELIEMHRKLKSTFVYVTHDQIEAMTMGTHIVVMNEGIIKQIGTPDEIHHDPDNVFVAQFIGDPGMNIITINGGKHKIGFRPRNSTFINAKDVAETSKMIIFKGKIETRENHGSEHLYSVNIGISKIYVKEAERILKDIDASVMIKINFEDLYVFNEFGDRIRDKKIIEDIIYEFKIGK